MSDMTLCAADTCRAKERCMRHPDCPAHFEISEWRQSWAYWHPSAGPSCPGFIDHARDWRGE